jgi:hypothetical protein
MSGSNVSCAHLPARLDIVEINLSAYCRIYQSQHPNPLGYGKSRSRFADPRPLSDDERFGVLYLGESFEVCFVEAVLRDRAVGSSGPFFLTRTELEQFMLAQISSTSPLRLVDLRREGPARMRIPTDAVRGQDHRLSMTYSLAFYQHPEKPDGLLYRSRINERINIALYDRAIQRLRCDASIALLQHAGLADLLDQYHLILMP